MHPLLHHLRHEFNARGIRWLFLRPPDNPDAPEGDVDLLIASADSASATSTLQSLGFVPLPAWGYGSDRFYLAFDPPTQQWIWLHLAFELHFGPQGTLRTHAATGVLTRRVPHVLGPCPAPDDRFWVLLLHCLLDKGQVKHAHRTTLVSLVEHTGTDSPLAQVFNAVAPAGADAAWVRTRVRAEDWQVLEECGQRMVPSWPADRGSLGRRISGIRVLRLLSRGRDGWRRGLSVALMGPDGAGKTTLTRGIETGFFFPSRSVYMGVGIGRIARIARALGAIRVGGRPILGRPPMTYAAYVSTLWFRYLTGVLFRMQGRLVVFDRYAYDAWLPMPTDVSRLKAWALRLQARAVPAPHLVVVLDVPGEVMFQRKGEFDAAHLERQRQHLLGLSTRIADLEIVDATQSADDVRRDVIERIWRRYQRKWER